MGFKTVADIQSYSDYKKEIKRQLGKLKATPVKFAYFEKFDYDDKKGAPLLLLLPELEAGLLDQVKKQQSAHALGRCKRVDTKTEDPKSSVGEVLHFEKAGSGAIKHSSLQKLLKEASVSELARLVDGPQEEGDLRATALGEKFVGEDQRMGWRTSDPNLKNTDTKTTKYDTTAPERDASSLAVDKKGRLQRADGKPLGLDGNTGFVVDPKTKKLHGFKPGVTTEPTPGKVQIAHHSTPLAGAPVGGAGTLVTELGKVKEIHDDSGHYKPSADFTLQVVEQLEALGAVLLDEKVVDANGRPPAPEHLATYKELKKQVAKIQLVFDEVVKRLGGKFDPANPPAELKKARAALALEVGKLRDLGFAPANKPAVVQLQGKFAIPADEFEKMKGDLDAINAWIEKKTQRKDVLPKTTSAPLLNSHEALNLEIGKALAVRLTTQQFKQTGGNEGAIGAKANAMELIRKRTQTPAHEPQDEAGSAIERTRSEAAERQKAALPKTAVERFEELGGKAAIVKLGFPKDSTHYLDGREDDAVAVLEGTKNLEELRDDLGV